MVDLVKIITVAVFFYFFIGVIVVYGLLTERQPKGPIQQFIWDHMVVSTILWPVALIAWPFSFLWKNYLSFNNKYFLFGTVENDCMYMPSKRQLKKEDPELYERVINYSPR